MFDCQSLATVSIGLSNKSEEGDAMKLVQIKEKFPEGTQSPVPRGPSLQGLRKGYGKGRGVRGVSRAIHVAQRVTGKE